MSVNKVLLLGNLGKDPELRFTKDQFPICSFSLATSDRRKDNSGNWVDQTEWHNVVVLGKSAENCAQYLKKGRQAFIEGKIQTRKWKDKEGKDRYTTEVLAQNVQFIGGGRGASQESSGYSVTNSPEETAGKNMVNSLPSADALAAAGSSGGSSGDVPFDDDDIPF